MTGNDVLVTAINGVINELPVLEHECQLTGMRVMALPPGKVDVSYTSDRHLIDVNLNPVEHMFALGSDKPKHEMVPKDSLAWFPAGVDFKLKTENNMWGLIMEIDPLRVESICPELTSEIAVNELLQLYTPDPHAALLGRMLIEHLQLSEIDPLYVEGLALATFARALPNSDTARGPASSARTDMRIVRAMEYINMHLGERLSVAILSSIASMSPSQFSRCFGEASGETVWSYVRRLRCERARELIVHTQETFVNIAHDCGFSSQAHLTTAFKAVFGLTPSAVRRAVN